VLTRPYNAARTPRAELSGAIARSFLRDDRFHCLSYHENKNRVRALLGGSTVQHLIRVPQI
jgi:hypothetical protein